MADIQAENVYFRLGKTDARNKQAFIYDIAKTIPADYNFEKWDTYNLGEVDNLKKPKTITVISNVPRRLRTDNKLSSRGILQAIQGEKENLLASIERMKAEIIAAEDKIKGLSGTLEDKTKLANSEYETKLVKLNADIGIADKYARQRTYRHNRIERRNHHSRSHEKAP